MQGIEDAGHDRNSEILSWLFPSLAFSTLPFPSLPSLCPFCLSSSNSLDPCERDIKGQESEGNACDMFVCTVCMYDSLTMCRSWWITYFAHFYRRAELVRETCIHSVVDGRNTLPHWITDIYPQTFHKSWYWRIWRIPLRRYPFVWERYTSLLKETDQKLIFGHSYFNNSFYFLACACVYACMYMFLVKISVFIRRVSRYRTERASYIAIFVHLFVKYVAYPASLR